MIRFTEKSLIIEIPCTDAEFPLEVLADLQTGLIHFVSIIDHKDAPPQYITWALHNLQRLLSEMVVNREQLGDINRLALKTPALLQAFK